jgi:flavin reductase (DIM6/NTAB) family NADH-FMN oxidoreductase RutF/rubredoxin
MDTKLFRDMTYGLFVLGVTTPEGKPTGCTVNTVFQLTTTPPVLAVSVNHKNYTNEILKQTGRVAISVLDQNVDVSIIGTMGFQSGRDTDKFAKVPHAVLESGLPVVTEGVCGTFICKVVDTKELSTHTLFFCEIEDAWRTGQGKVPPMTYAYYHQVKNGTEPPTAPTYLPPEKEEKPAKAEKWVCSICKYEYTGDVPFEELPDDWVCPICGQPKSVFEKQ